MPTKLASMLGTSLRAKTPAMLERYLGEWRLSRTIVDARAGSSIECSGRARLEALDTGIRYDESVSYMLGGRVMRATRAYIYRLADAAITATFADGRPFFRATVDSAGTATAVHRCGDDLYVGLLTLREAATWHTRWDISGTKAVRILTRYTRAG